MELRENGRFDKDSGQPEIHQYLIILSKKYPLDRSKCTKNLLPLPVLFFSKKNYYFWSVSSDKVKQESKINHLNNSSIYRVVFYVSKYGSSPPKTQNNGELSKLLENTKTYI